MAPAFMSFPLRPEILYGAGTVILFGVLIWAVLRSRLKSPKARAIREEAVHEEYTSPQQYAEDDQDKLAAKAEAAEENARNH